MVSNSRKNEDGRRVYYDTEGNRYHSVTNVVGSIDEKGLEVINDHVYNRFMHFHVFYLV